MIIHVTRQQHSSVVEILSKEKNVAIHRPDSCSRVFCLDLASQMHTDAAKEASCEEKASGKEESALKIPSTRAAKRTAVHR